jgi:hypothetical protein
MNINNISYEYNKNQNGKNYQETNTEIGSINNKKFNERETKGTIENLRTISFKDETKNDSIYFAYCSMDENYRDKYKTLFDEFKFN